MVQLRTSASKNLLEISNDEQRVQQIRLSSYPAAISGIGYWLEGTEGILLLNRLSKNFFENLSPNLYFFANSSKPRVGIDEFEKFPHILLPFFLTGACLTAKAGGKIYLSVLIPLFALAFIGNVNDLGPFSVFPFIAAPTARGLEKLDRKYLVLFLIFYILTLTQIYFYENAN